MNSHWIRLLLGLFALVLGVGLISQSTAAFVPNGHATSEPAAQDNAAPVVPAPALTNSAKPAAVAASHIPVAGPPSSAPSISAAVQPAVVIAISGEIDDYNRDQFFRHVKQARAMGAKTIIVDLDTYGGLVTSGLDLSRFIKGIEDMHTIAYVDPKAISAGAMIAMACDEIVMSDSSVIGDCEPISLRQDGSLEPLPAAERAKIESPVLADFEDSARHGHHDPLIARAMVTLGTAVHWVQGPQGQRGFANDADFKALVGEGWKPVADVPDPINSNTTLLTFHTHIAVLTGLASGQAQSIETLAAQRHLNIVANFQPQIGEKLLEFLNSGYVRMILLMVFSASLYIFLHAPGHGAAEAAALVSIALLLGAPLLTGYATWWEVLLIFAGLTLVAFELFVLPHTGAMVVVGIVMMLVGMLMTFVGFDPRGTPGMLPSLQGTWMAIEHGLLYMTGGLVGSILFMAWFGRHLPDLPIFNRLVIKSGNGADALIVPQRTHAGKLSWLTVGTMGRAITPLKPGGSAEFYDEITADSRVVSVVSETGFVQPGTPVMVRGVDGSSVKVRAV